MNGEVLQTALQMMPATGAFGFEGLSARLLELLLDERFLLARSGDQPSGDSHNTKRDLAVQAKRFSDESPNAKQIEGDFDHCLRSLVWMDIYLVAVTRDTAQLNDTINAMREKSAVDIVVWDFANDSSALATLCVEFWPNLQDFAALREIDGKVCDWIQDTRILTKHQERLKHLKEELLDCTQTMAKLRGSASAYLRRRFQIEPDSEPFVGQAIRLGNAISRASHTKSVLDWWRKNESRVAVMSAQEGFGKTWVAAQSALAISSEKSSIVLWLDSIQWRECKSIEDVLIAAVSTLTPGNEEKSKRLVRKLQERWSKHVLIVLDGVSELGALPAAQEVLQKLRTKETSDSRLLFTTRPLEEAKGFDPSVWRGFINIPISPFDDGELSVALARENIPETELTEELRGVARISRYFATCIRLRKKLFEFSNISVSLVLWTDLLDKIQGIEPRIREALGFTKESDAVEVLMMLATKLPEATKEGKAVELLNACFDGKYGEARNYLTEIRIMEKAGRFDATLNRHHITLGRALLLQEILAETTKTNVREIADELIAALEPLSGEDGSTEALFVTLQLTATRAEKGVSLGENRAALLYAWVFSHNSRVSDYRLDFWCAFDTDAYAHFVAAHFEALYAGNAQELAVKPLARLWRRGDEVAAVLEPHLKRWLLLTWFDGASGTELTHERHQLPIARTGEQIRLAAVAVSLLSLRRSLNFLPTLALSLATDELTCQKHGEHTIRFKCIYENLGILLRWHYTETTVPELENLARNFESDAVMLNGIRKLAWHLDLVELPEILQLPPPEPFPHYLGTPAVQLLREGCRVFGCQKDKLYPNELDFGYLAVRSDLGKISDSEIDLVAQKTEKICQAENIRNSTGRTVEDGDLEALWPWYARFHPAKAGKIAGQLLLRALRRECSEQIQPTFWFLAGVIPILENSDLEEWEKLAHEKASCVEVENGNLKNYLGLSVAEAALLTLPEEGIHQWIIASSKSEARRQSMCFAPLMDLIPKVLPEKTKRLAIEKCLLLGDGPLSRSTRGSLPTELEYWCYIAALASGQDKSLFDWATARLKKTSPGEQLNFSLLQLWLRSAPAGELERALGASGDAHWFGKRSLRAWAVSNVMHFDPKAVRGSYEDLMKKLSQGFAGGIFALSERDTDLKRWGTELFALAVRLLGKAPFARTSCVETQHFIDLNGAVESVSFERTTDPNTNSWTKNKNTWGVDYGELADLSIRPRGRKLLEEELAAWRLDGEQMEAWEHYDLHEFGAWSALKKWSKLYQEEFLPRARSTLTLANQDPSNQHHIGGFLESVVLCLLPSAPEEAWMHYVNLHNGQLRLSVQTTYCVPSFYAVLWDLNQCNLEGHDALRKQLLLRALNEFEVMVQCVAALANKAEGRLLEYSEELLALPLARDRALGVSILAWIGTEASITRLSMIKLSDENQWVREHAEWAREVSSQEKCCRELFRELLYKEDPMLISAGLQVMKPGLTPLARWWHREILNEEKGKGLLLSGKNAAVLESFWHHIDSTTNNHVTVFKRGLEAFCRGEKLDRLKTPRLAPWWKWV